MDCNNEFCERHGTIYHQNCQLPINIVQCNILDRYKKDREIKYDYNSIEAISDYDCGLINDYGGGDVEWWRDYVRAEINRCNEYWREQTKLA